MEYDQLRASNGVGNSLMVTIYTTVATNVYTAEQGRGKRGLEVDVLETNALRNIVHFNCYNPFPCTCGDILDGEGEERDSRRKASYASRSAQQQQEKSVMSKNPYGEQLQAEEVSIIGSRQRKAKDIMVMVQPKDISMLDQTMIFDRTMMNESRRQTLQSPAKPGEPVYEELEEKQTTELFYVERVIDWSKRIAAYPEYKKAIYQKCFERLKECTQLITEDAETNGWKEGWGNKKRGLATENKIVDGKPHIRCRFTFDYDPLTVLRFYFNLKNREQYEKLIVQNAVLDNLGVNLHYIYQRSMRMLTVSPRDCYCYVLITVEEDDSINVVICDDDDSEQPVEPGVVRASIAGAMRLIPLKDQPGKCHCDYMASVDFQGNIPPFLVT